MGRYSIKELEHLSGIKAHTIRIWEKRYSIIQPERTDTNIRFYSDDDLRKIINVSLLNCSGYKISKIAEMSDTEINQKVLDLSTATHNHSIHINQLVAAMVQLDEEGFEKALSGFFLRYNFEQTMTEIVYPFLEKTGILWQTGNISPAQEHFISNLIRQKIIVGIDGLPLQSDSKRIAILFLPEHELHEIGLLFCHYLLRKSGYRTIYLGQAVPYNDLAEIFKQYQPQLLVTILTSPLQNMTLEQYLNMLAADFAGAKVFVSGSQLKHINPSSTVECVKPFKSVSSLMQSLATV